MDALARIAPGDALAVHMMTQGENGVDKALGLSRDLANAEGAQGDRELWRAAEGFEEIFLSQMMKQMRKTVFESEDSLDSSNASKIYRAMSDEQVARAAASRHQFGIARMIHDSLVGNLSIRQNAEPPKPSGI